MPQSHSDSRMPSVLTVLMAGLFALISAPLSAATPSPAGSPVPKFEKDIRPILKAHCFHCHGETPKGGLDLRLTRLISKGGNNGPAITPGKKGESLLFEKVSSNEMPPGDKPKLSPEEVRLIGAWIDAGAQTARPEPEKAPAGTEITPEDREFWFYHPIRAHVPPTFQPEDRVKTPIDAFILQKLKQKGFAFSPEADKFALMKRAYFDLIGLPPTPEEVEKFLADSSPDAYERLIDHLLSLPQYGERWGRHWLDVAGYADSDGYTDADAIRPWAYKYRDYVIKSFNADMPFDQFLQEQLAGDETLNAKQRNFTPQEQDKLIATGFLRMGADGTATNGIDQDLARNMVMAETVKIVSSSLLGLTVGCAQCHDHRYDPILQSDYYRLRAVFEPAYNWKNWRTPPERLISLYTDADLAKVEEVRKKEQKLAETRNAKEQEFIKAAFAKELEKLPMEQREEARKAFETEPAKRTPEQNKILDANPSLKITPGVLYQYDPKAIEELKKITDEITKISAERPREELIQALTERPADPLPVTHLFNRGDHNQPKDPIPPGSLTICAADGAKIEFPAKDPKLPTSGRRTAFANWIIGKQNPLTSRVLVNRIWMHHFGRGLVNTPSDFGHMGELPSHPELLDWLASDFTSNGWKLKRLHKLIMTSTVYRQSSARPEKLAHEDSDNTLYGHFSVRRLDAEALRDRILFVAGVLNPEMFGPAIPIKEDSVGQVVVEGDPPAPTPLEPLPVRFSAFRRSVYIQARRSRPLAMLQAFDAPVMQTNCERRPVSTVAPQALMMMNSEFVVFQGGYLAQKANKTVGADQSKQIRYVWQQALLRNPTDQEVKEAEGFMKKRLYYYRTPNLKPAVTEPVFEAMTSLCQVLLSSNEFLYVD
ncbi:MAG: DUF1553 domain-containing protein [Planctomycetales bacterium]